MLRASLLWLLLGMGINSASAQSAGDSRPILFQNVRVFDGSEIEPRADVLVRGTRIEAIGSKLPVPDDAERIDGSGKTLLPGLIDCHTHTFAESQLVQAAVLGVTTELDMAGNPGFAAEMRRVQMHGGLSRADLLSAGTPVTAQGGHPTQLPWFGQIPTIASPQQARQFITDRIEEGSDYIKIIYDDGSAYGLRFPTITRETLAAVTAEAQRQGKLAVAHISTHKSMEDAVAAGVDGVVHLFLDEPIDAQLVHLAQRKGIFVIPTLTVLQSAAGIAGGSSLAVDTDLKPFLPQDDVANLKTAFPKRDESRADFAVARQAALALHRAGIPVLAGSDAPNPGTAHGASLHRELELLVEAGLPPVEALAAATSRPAKHFGLSDRGRIAAGYRADLLLVEGDPTEEIRATRRIRGVWKDGRAIDREANRRDRKPAADAVVQPSDVAGRSGTKDRLISDFDGDKVEAHFGYGWSVSTDRFVGGKSTAQYRIGRSGAKNSAGSLHITGSVEDRPEPRWAGVSFSPGLFPMVAADLSDHRGIRFWAKGDGKSYYAMLFFQKRGFAPSFKTFKAGDTWQEHRFAFQEFDGCDGSDVTGIFIGSGVETGDFSLQIDDVRLE